MGLGKFLLALAFLIGICQSPLHSSYEFNGLHYTAEFYECKNLDKTEGLYFSMMQACRDTGAHVIDSSVCEFPGGGCTIVIVLSESHASIHTYPEYNACFLDIFTCGNHCDVWKFANRLHWYLEPQSHDERVVQRGDNFIEEHQSISDI